MASAGLNGPLAAHAGAEEPQGFLGAVVRAAGGPGPVELEPDGPLLVTTLEDARRVLSTPTDFAVPFDVSRRAIRRGASSERTIPLLAAAAVETGRRTFADELTSAADAFTVVDLDTLLFLREPVSRSTTAALVPEAVDADRDLVADQVLAWIDALAPVISAARAPRRWSAPARAERRALHSLLDTLGGLGCPDAPARATALAAGIQVPIAAGAWALTQLACRPDLQQALRDSPALALPVVWETLRLFPPSWLLPRVSTREVSLGDTVVPAYRAVLVSPLALGRLPALVPGPDDDCPPLDEFAPSRWVGGRRRPGGWLPFGAGPHACPGRNLGLAQLTHLVSWAGAFELAAPRAPEIDTTRGLSPRPSAISASLAPRGA